MRLPSSDREGMTRLQLEVVHYECTEDATILWVHLMQPQNKRLDLFLCICLLTSLIPLYETLELC
jgi:hypothetical protein